jgi:hypothetical protein
MMKPVNTEGLISITHLSYPFLNQLFSVDPNESESLLNKMEKGTEKSSGSKKRKPKTWRYIVFVSETHPITLPDRRSIWEPCLSWQQTKMRASGNAVAFREAKRRTRSMSPSKKQPTISAPERSKHFHSNNEQKAAERLADEQKAAGERAAHRQKKLLSSSNYRFLQMEKEHQLLWRSIPPRVSSQNRLKQGEMKNKINFPETDDVSVSFLFLNFC